VNSDLILLPGKLTGVLVYVYNMQSLLERGNNCQNCAYCNRIFAVNFTVFSGVFWPEWTTIYANYGFLSSLPCQFIKTGILIAAVCYCQYAHF